MEVEITDESIERIMVAEITQSLEWARTDLAMYDSKENAVGEIVDLDRQELRKDIEAYERILNYWTVQS